MGGAADAVSGVYIAHLVRDDNARRQPDPLRGARRRRATPISSTRPRTRPGRHTTTGAATACTTARPTGPRLQGQLQPAVRHPGRHPRRAGLLLSSRVPDDPVPGGQRVRRQLQSGIDTDRSGVAAPTTRSFLSVGHDEYWSGNQRANVEAARDAGVNLAFFRGNNMFWKTRWENGIDGSNTPYRTLVTYKETHANAKIDPTSTWTGTWRDPRFSPPADGGRPENAAHRHDLAGQSRATTAIDRARGRRARTGFWRNTSMATLAPGTVGTLAPSIARLRVGRRPRQRRPARPACSTCRPPRSPRTRSCSTTAPPGLRARPPTA